MIDIPGLTTLASVIALIAGGFAVSSAPRPHGEEDDGRVEPLLATELPRLRWLLGHLGVTVLEALAGLALAGFGMGLTYGPSSRSTQ